MERINFSSIPKDGTFTLPFGQHKDSTIEETPSGYLAWLANNHDDKELVDACQIELKYRTENDCHFDDDDEYINTKQVVPEELDLDELNLG